MATKRKRKASSIRPIVIRPGELIPVAVDMNALTDHDVSIDLLDQLGLRGRRSALDCSPPPRMIND